MSAPVASAAEWQELFDRNFPQGAVVSRVLPDGTLSADVMYLCPVLVVMAMRGEWPLVVGIGLDAHDVQLHVASWEEIDRSGHFVVRVRTEGVGSTPADHFEISSWLTPVMAESFAQVRESQRSWLLQVSASAEAELEAESETESAVDSADEAR